MMTVSAKHVDSVKFEYYPNPKSGEIERLEKGIKEKKWELNIHKKLPELLETLNEEMAELQAHLKKLEQSVRFKLQPKTSSTTVNFTVFPLLLL